MKIPILVVGCLLTFVSSGANKKAASDISQKISSNARDLYFGVEEITWTINKGSNKEQVRAATFAYKVNQIATWNAWDVHDWWFTPKVLLDNLNGLEANHKMVSFHFHIFCPDDKTHSYCPSMKLALANIGSLIKMLGPELP